jgi:hypothetical protein
MNRLGFLGGSDMRRIMSGDWLKLWEEKTGRVESEDLSKVLPVQLGSYTEQFNLDWFAQEYEVEIKDSQREFKLNWNGVPLKGQVDGRINRSHDMPDIMPQMQFYMWLAQSSGCYLSVIFGNRRWESVYVQLDWDYIHKMQVHITEFWRLVREDIRPFNDEDVPPISIDKIKVDGLVRRDASSDNEFISRCHDYIEQEQSAKLFESAKADLKAMVGDDEREVYCDLLTIKRDKRGSLRVTVKENH